MRKIFTIAVREYRAMVGTKAFLISIIMMPMLMLGGLFATEFLQDAGSVSQRRIAIVDRSGSFYEELSVAVEQRNAMLFPEAEPDEVEPDSHDGPSGIPQTPLRKKSLPGFSREKYILESVAAGDSDDDFGMRLSQRIRQQDLYAFVVIPAGVDGETRPHADTDNRIRFHAQDSSLSEARVWLASKINEIVKSRRLIAADIDPLIVQQLSQPVPMVGMGLVEKSTDGTINSKEVDDPLAAIFLPMGVMMLMFMVIFMASQPMLESVLEEKSQRIAEVLLGSASPFQLMSGKLIGTIAGSMTVFVIYLIGAWVMAMGRGWTDQIPFQLAPWFLVFQVFGVLFYASIFLAIGASVSQLKEAQSMLLPVWMLMMTPMFVWIFIVRDPLGPMATYFSLFPPATPTAMMLRMATGQTIPLWQPLLGVVLLLFSTIFIVIIAGRIFRVGILWQGKTPKFREILKWAVTG
jgi:ABC-type Na+ efflux pump permease subunit